MSLKLLLSLTIYRIDKLFTDFPLSMTFPKDFFHKHSLISWIALLKYIFYKQPVYKQLVLGKQITKPPSGGSTRFH